MVSDLCAVAEIIFIIMHQRICNKRIILLISSVGMVFTFMMPHTQLFRIIGRILSALFFITLGYSLRFIFENEKNDFIQLLIAFSLTFAASYFNTAADIYSLRFGNPALYLIAAISGTYMIIAICRYSFATIFSFFGNLSLIMMGTHQMFLPLLHFHPVLNFMIILLADIPLALLLKKIFPILA